jgi:hypothetical protein
MRENLKAKEGESYRERLLNYISRLVTETMPKDVSDEEAELLAKFSLWSSSRSGCWKGSAVGTLMISDLSERKGGWVKKNKITVNDGTGHDRLAL